MPVAYIPVAGHTGRSSVISDVVSAQRVCKVVDIRSRWTVPATRVSRRSLVLDSGRRSCVYRSGPRQTVVPRVVVLKFTVVPSPWQQRHVINVAAMLLPVTVASRPRESDTCPYARNQQVLVLTSCAGGRHNMPRPLQVNL